MKIETLTSSTSLMLCEPCARTVRRIGTQPGRWDGPEPELFAYAARPDTWRGAHHTTDSSLSESVRQHCYICTPLLNAFPPEEQRRGPFSRTFYEIRPRGPQRWDLRITIELPADDVSPTRMIECHGIFKILPRNVLSVPSVKLQLTDSTSSPSCQTQVKKWLKKCECSHLACNKDWRITRHYSFRLLNIRNGKIRLEEFPPGSGPKRYVSLSHRWNENDNESVSRLTELNRHRWTAGVDEGVLSASFRDAIEVSRWMDVNYLWIDALCIVQDSKDDWQLQSSIMGDIYAGSYCNIAAMNDRGHSGFLKERCIEVIEPYLIRDPQGTLLETTHVIGYNDFWCNSLLSPQLHNRAWVLQERQMSPRTIHFGEQIFWECREHKACEVHPTGIPEEFSNRRTRAWRQGTNMFNPESKVCSKTSNRAWLDPLWSFLWSPKPQEDRPSEDEAYRFWSSLVERYMECELTFGSDKLVAIQGPANKVSNTTGARYLAGLWDNDELVPSLLWYSPAKQQGNGTPSKKHLYGMESYRAPSWSWASLDGIIVWEWPTQHGHQLLLVDEVITASQSEATHGAPRPIEMRVRGTLLAARIQMVNNDEDGNPVEDGSYAIQPTPAALTGHQFDAIVTALSEANPIILLDEAMSTRPVGDVFLLPVVNEWRGQPGQPAAEVAGLILAQRLLDGRVVFERIGVFCFDNAAMDDADHDGTGTRLQAAFSEAGMEPVILI